MYIYFNVNVDPIFIFNLKDIKFGKEKNMIICLFIIIQFPLPSFSHNVFKAELSLIEI